MNYKDKTLQIGNHYDIIQGVNDNYDRVFIVISTLSRRSAGNWFRTKNSAWRSAYEKIETSVLRKLTL